MEKKQTPLNVETFTQDEARRKNIPMAVFQSMLDKD